MITTEDEELKPRLLFSSFLSLETIFVYVYIADCQENY